MLLDFNCHCINHVDLIPIDVKLLSYCMISNVFCFLLRTHSTENLSEQETIQKFYQQHQEQYEEWVRKTRQQNNNNNRSNNNNNYYYNAWQGQTSRGQHHYSNPKEWWGDLNPNDPHYEIKSKIFQYLNRLTAADLFLFTAFGKVASLFMMMFFIFFQCRKKSWYKNKTALLETRVHLQSKYSDKPKVLWLNINFAVVFISVSESIWICYKTLVCWEVLTNALNVKRYI